MVGGRKVVGLYMIYAYSYWCLLCSLTNVGSGYQSLVISSGYQSLTSASAETAVFLFGLSTHLADHSLVIYNMALGPLSFTQCRHENFLLLFHANLETWKTDAFICILLMLTQSGIGLQVFIALKSLIWVIYCPYFPTLPSVVLI